MSERGPSFAVFVYLLSRAATFVAAAGIALISRSSVGDVLARWDGGWYLSIVRDGYPSFVPPGSGVAAQSSLAFFPGYPLVVRAVSGPLGLSPVFVGCAVSLVAGLGAAVALWHLAVRLTDETTADRTVVLFAFLPSAFVMSMIYADALFLFLAACCLIALLDERWVRAGALAAAAGFVRPTAVALCLACAWGAFVAIRRGGSLRALAAPALAPWGALLYLGYTWIHTGDALAFFKVESRGWGNRLDIGAANTRAVLRHLGEPRLTFFVTVLAVVVGGLAIGLWLLVRWHAPGVVVVYVSVVMGLSVLGSNPVSVPRFLIAAFPLLIPLAGRLSPRATMAVAATSGVLMGTLFFVNGLSTLPP
ncbi:MAG: mannosyltransferase family protein [Actinomycetota bacterium]